MADWSYAVGSWLEAQPFHQLFTVRDRKLSLRLDAAGQASCVIDGRSEDAAVIEPLATDLWVYRDAVLLFRGRIVSAPETIASDRHEIALEAVDYRGLLERRMLWVETTYLQQPQGEIAWALVQSTQTQTGGTFGITRGTVEPGMLRDRTYKAGDNIGNRIAELGRVEDGFEWWVTPDRTFELAARRGQDRNAVLDYGGTVQSMRREPEVAGYANAVLATGGQQTVPAGRVGDPVGDPRGRWEVVRSFPSVVEQPTVETKADHLLAEGLKPPVAYTVDLLGGVWPSEVPLEPGDSALLRLQSGLRNEQASVRVEEVTVSIDDSGVESVNATATAAAVSLSRMPELVVKA